MQKLTGQYKTRGGDSHAPNQVHRAAFFDVDRTLIRGDSQEQEARFYLARHKPSPGYLFSMVLTVAALQLHRLGWLTITSQNKIYLRSYRGKTRVELEKLGAALFNRVIANQFLGGTLEILEQHRRQGHLIVLVSATTPHLLHPFESFLKPDYIFCTDLEFDDAGHCIGKALDGVCCQEKKQAVVRDFAGENHIDLSSSHAYSDHHSDIPFLSSVGHPAVVNPTGKMAAHARKMGWPVHRFD